jgi:hypothetical protein
MLDHEGKEVHKSVDYALIGHVMNTVPIRYCTILPFRTCRTK